MEVKIGRENLQVESGTTIKQLAEKLGVEAFAGKCSDKILDVRTVLQKDCELELCTFTDKAGQRAYWHTTAHILAQAVSRLFPQVRLGMGPATESGFFYDFDRDQAFSDEDLAKIESEMQKIAEENLKIERVVLGVDEARKLMEGQVYKLELIEEHAKNGDELVFYRHGEFVDLCAGPHLMETGQLGAVKLLNCTGAYWRGDAANPMLKRVYGVSFPDKAGLDAHLKMLEEAKKRDHRRIGREMELFDLFEEGHGFPFFFPNGMVLRNALLDFWHEQHKKDGYVEIKTPMLLNRELWLRSGHWDHYKDNMYMTEIDEQPYAVKPMNCPGCMLVFKNRPRSYRELPLRLAELGLVHRHELSGALHGLMRVRCFTQDDSHIFMTPDQVESEILGVMKLIDKIYSTFGFQYHIELSTRPENSMGSDEQWELATNGLVNALEKCGKAYKINEGDGAFYGPKIDFHLRDSIGRTWQCGTIQLDMQMPERFDLTYVGEDSQRHRPVMVHRVIFGSIERFIGILTEHFAGAFPLWLAPEQVRILPISEKFLEGAQKICNQLCGAGLRASVDSRSEKLGAKIRDGQMRKVPYLLVVGAKEIESGTVSVREQSRGDLGAMGVDEFISRAGEEISSKKFNI